MTGYIIPLLFRLAGSDSDPAQIETTPSEAAAWAAEARPTTLDNRVYCRRARAYAAGADLDRLTACPELDSAGYCRGNGAERGDRCVFTEPEGALVWRRIRASVAEYQEKGWE